LRKLPQQSNPTLMQINPAGIGNHPLPGNLPSQQVSAQAATGVGYC
jgi:hypothetical protein